MNALLTDPVVLICSGLILAGIVGFFWGIGKFRRMSSADAGYGPTDDVLSPAPDLRDIVYRPPPAAAQAPKAGAPAVSKEVADRLESMTQRLSEMQTVLMKQSAGGAAVAGAAPGAVGQGFSPETIDKLLKIIGNVIQQVDILQKNLNVPKDAAAPKAESAPFTRI